MENQTNKTKTKKTIRLIALLTSVLIVLGVAVFSVAQESFFKTSLTGTVTSDTGDVFISLGDGNSVASSLAGSKDGAIQEGSFVGLFKKQLRVEDGNAHNIAQSGNTAYDLSLQFEESNNLKKIKTADVVVVNIGVEDITKIVQNVFAKILDVKTMPEAIKTISSAKDKEEINAKLKKINERLYSKNTRMAFDTAVKEYKNYFFTMVKSISQFKEDSVVLVNNLYNPYKGVVLKDENGKVLVDLERITGKYIDKLNEYLDTSTDKDTLYKLVDISNIESKHINLVYKSTYSEENNFDYTLNAEGHKFVYAKIIKVYEKTGDKAVLLTSNGSKYDGYYDTFADAWNTANTKLTSQNATVKLLKNLTAENGKFGSGKGFGNTGAIKPVARSSKNISLTLNLNGYTVNRGLYNNKKTTKNGEVFNISVGGVYNISNGTICGAKNEGNGGGVYIDNDNATVNLSNLTIKNNYDSGNGAGVYVEDCKAKVNFNDVDVNNNTCKGYGGGVYIKSSVENKSLVCSNIKLENEVNVSSNHAKVGRQNFVLRDSGKTAQINNVSNLSKDSKIYISFSDEDNKGLMVKEAKAGQEKCFVSERKGFKVYSQKLKSGKCGIGLKAK